MGSDLSRPRSSLDERVVLFFEVLHDSAIYLQLNPLLWLRSCRSDIHVSLLCGLGLEAKHFNVIQSSMVQRLKVVVRWWERMVSEFSRWIGECKWLIVRWPFYYPLSCFNWSKLNLCLNYLFVVVALRLILKTVLLRWAFIQIWTFPDLWRLRNFFKRRCLFWVCRTYRVHHHSLLILVRRIACQYCLIRKLRWLLERSCSLLMVEHLLSLWSQSSSRLDFDSLRGMLSKGNTLCDAITSDGPELACNELLEIW